MELVLYSSISPYRVAFETHAFEIVMVVYKEDNSEVLRVGFDGTDIKTLIRFLEVWLGEDR